MNIKKVLLFIPLSNIPFLFCTFYYYNFSETHNHKNKINKYISNDIIKRVDNSRRWDEMRIPVANTNTFIDNLQIYTFVTYTIFHFKHRITNRL